MSWMAEPQAWVAFLTLTGLELVLGIDNIIFISILAGRLPEAQRPKARFLGLAIALGMRVAMLFSLSWMAGLTAPLFSLLGHGFSGRDLVLLAGGLFLLGKSTHEIHNKLEGDEHGAGGKAAATLGAVIAQIVVIDAVFSIDSVITAVGMVDDVGIMVAAVIASMAFMLAFAAPVSAFVERHPTVKMLALSFLLLIGVTLVADGLGHHIPKGYVYFSMAFSVFVEFLNLRVKAKSAPVHLRSGAP